jgi:hypothetical protein
MLIVPVAQLALSRQATVIALTALVLLDQARGIGVAAQQITSTASINVMRFMNAPQSDGDIFASEVLSFVYSGSSPLIRDRYHGIYHLTPELLLELQRRIVLTSINDPRGLGAAGIEPGDRVYYSNNTMVRRPPWGADNLPANIADFLLVAGTATTVDLVLRNGNYEREGNDGSYIMFIPASTVDPQMPLITTGALAQDAAAALFGDVAGRSRLQVTGVLVDALCQGDRCSYR